MKFNVLNPQELAYKNNISSGIYDFEVLEAEETISKQKIPMIKLLLKITHDKEKHKIFDYLSSESVWKIKQFLEATNEIDCYSQGELTTDDCIGRAGILRVRTYENEYGTQTKVVSYFSRDTSIEDTE